MAVKLKPIALSFKNSKEDKELYEWIISHSNMSGFIKDILKKEMRGEYKESARVENSNSSLIDLDF